MFIKAIATFSSILNSNMFSVSTNGEKIKSGVGEMVKGVGEVVQNDSLLSKLTDPSVQQEWVYNATIKTLAFTVRAILALLIFKIGKIVITKIIAKYKKTKHYKTLNGSVKSFLESFLKIALKISLILFCLVIIGFKGTSLITFLGTMGLGIGLALKDTLANLAGGIVILTFDTFTVGHYIESGGFAGEVTSINVFSTEVKTFDNKAIIIPNGYLISNPLTNYTTRKVRRVDVNIGVSYGADVKKAREALLNLASADERILKAPHPQAVVEEYADSSINLKLRVWCATEEYWTIYYDLMGDVKNTFDKAGIEIPFPQMDLHIKEQPGQGN